MAKQQAPLRQRLNYWFDNVMAQGMWAKIRLLLLVTLVFVLLFGILIFLINPEMTLQNGVWTTLLMVLGKGIKGDINDYGPLHAALMLLVVFYAMFFMATLIGLINGGLREKIDDLARGRGKVIESGHTIILGYNEATLALIGELIEAQSNIYHPQSIVILAPVEQAVMDNEIRAKFGKPWEHPKTKIICRTGSCYGLADLQRCSLETSRSVIICADNDFGTVKAIMACSTILGEHEHEGGPFAITVIREERNMSSAQIAEGTRKAGDWLELLAMQGVLARIMVHTSRQPGLSEVFTELFNFADNEFYIIDHDISFELLVGKSIAEINRYLKNSIAVGVTDGSGKVLIGSPNETVFNEGDALVVIEAEDNPLRVLPEAHPVTAGAAIEHPRQEATSILVLGESAILEDILLEYAHYLEPGSTVCIASNGEDVGHTISDGARAALDKAGIGMKAFSGFTGKRGLLERILSENAPESVVVLADRNATDPETDDERIMQLLLYLREYRDRHEAKFSITSEINMEQNRELAAATGPDDFIIGQHFSALLMAQISYNRGMRRLFDSLLSHDGYEVYMKKASRYVTVDEPIDLFSVAQAVAQKGEVFIGFRQKRGLRFDDPVVNPPKFKDDMKQVEEYVFGPDDCFVVLAESAN